MPVQQAHRYHEFIVAPHPKGAAGAAAPGSTPVIVDSGAGTDQANNLKGAIMNKDQVKGSLKEAAGKVQEKTGELTNNHSQQVKGAAKQVEGNVQKAYGDAKEATKD